MPGFVFTRWRHRPVRPRWAGAADRPELARAGERPADGDHGRAIRCGRLPFAPVAPSPCVTAQWIVGADARDQQRQPLVLMDSRAICAPNGTPLMIVATQARVTAQ